MEDTGDALGLNKATWETDPVGAKGGKSKMAMTTTTTDTAALAGTDAATTDTVGTDAAAQDMAGPDAVVKDTADLDTMGPDTMGRKLFAEAVRWTFCSGWT